MDELVEAVIHFVSANFLAVAETSTDMSGLSDELLSKLARVCM